MADDSSNNPSLDILVRTKGDTTGIDQVSKSQDELAKKTKAGGDAHKEANEAAEKNLLTHRQLHQIFHGLNELVPGLGFAMQAAFSPVGATVAIGISAVKLFHEHMKELNEEFRKFEEEAAEPATERTEAWRTAVVEAATGMAELQDRLQQAARGEQSMNEKMRISAETMRDVITLAGSLADAMKETELAKAESDHAGGLTSDAEYFDKKLQIEKHYLEEKRALEERGKMTDILVERRQLELAQTDQAGLEEKARLAEYKKVEANENLAAMEPKDRVLKRLQTASGAAKDIEGKTPKDLLELFEEYGFGDGKSKEAFNVFMADKFGKGKGPYYTGGEELYDKWAEAQGNLKSARTLYDKYPKDLAAKQVAANLASREADRAAKAAEENQSFITDTGRKIGLDQARFGALHENNQAISREEDKSSLYRSLSEHENKGKELHERIAKSLESRNQVDAGTIAVMEKNDREVADLKRRIAALEGAALNNRAK